MDDNKCFPLRHLASAKVGVQSTLDRQDILIQHSDLGQRLVCLLAFGRADIVRQEEATCWRIAHDRQVDGLLVELIDLLISIRHTHPAMVQLELELEPTEP